MVTTKMLFEVLLLLPSNSVKPVSVEGRHICLIEALIAMLFLYMV